MGKGAFARGALLALFGLLGAMTLPAGCAADDLSAALAGGACKSGKCADGYECVAERCVPIGSADASTGGTAGTGGSAGADSGPDAGCAACKPTETCCDGQCTNTLISSAHCGTCGNACPGTACSNGSCTNTCAFGFFDCDGNKANGCEAEVAKDPKNCGNCNTPCSAPTQGTPVCGGGVCDFSCGNISRCGTECTDTTTDPKNCGGCAKQCPEAPHGTPTCTAAACGVKCDTGYTDCGGLCVDVKTNPSHCGACGTLCSTGQVCDGGVCGSSCSSGKLQCGASCVDVSTSIEHCGACGNACPSTANGVPTCTGGTCGVSCNPNFTQCGSGCVDKNIDPNNCGACGKACDEPVNGVAKCTAGVCDFSCVGGFAKCGSSCVDPTTDPNNCGSCGTKCPAGQVCSNGACALSCSGGTVACSGACVDTKTDPQNCGSCGTSCAGDPNGTATCTNGACGIQCSSGYSLCGGVCKNTQSDVTNCGTCGNTCSAPAGGTAICDAGSCTFTCTGVLTKCGNGCVNTQTDPTHCGNCTTVCDSGKVCSNGACTLDCGSLVNCSGQCVSTQTDPQNCGGCGSACTPPAHATATCNAGSCGFTCSAGFAKCGSTTTCFDINNDPTHCGATCKVCTIPAGGVATCAGGQCGFTCNAGLTKCGTACVDIQTDPANCGGCGTACGSSQVCSNGACVQDCGTLTNCNGQCVDTKTDPDHCGNCTTVCPTKPYSTRKCSAGVCSYTCTSSGNNSIQDCNPAQQDGCENLMLDTRYCGSCARPCSGKDVMSMRCFDGLCASTCDVGFNNCLWPSGGNADDGCEFSYDDENCGSCKSSCSAAKLTCDVTAPDVGLCVCSADEDCAQGSVAKGTCTDGVCGGCGGATLPCKPGEVCNDFSISPGGPASYGCSCNGGPSCGAGLMCCPPPAGGPDLPNCVNLAANRDNCGACGRACPPGFTCQLKTCRCDGNTDCSAGTSGTCLTLSLNAGKCMCHSQICAFGERCQPDGSCG